MSDSRSRLSLAARDLDRALREAEMAVSRGGVEQSPAYTARQIAALRKREKLSEERFAYAIGVNVKAVRAWERGIHRPSRQSLKLLNLLDRKGLDGIE